ncbi:Fe-Mn family superoxide dismutase [Candidatus Methylacidithermus pantelleriae]|uniref:Putative Superoxide dismutase n=1 Tax=Candidatus Methylacidithermus pantelleriae TaxID=2744239 RepID=A0A8J2BMC2_9BACT|nr:Fe-Mn family superoxide dismutase [Candidatus Methylacidithermus pantelleriae]CAF0691922.1 putative Superoxide dismutase [Candidatus Methylacidithermus pantelleriae]
MIAIAIDRAAQFRAQMQGITARLPSELVDSHLALYSSYVQEANRLWEELHALSHPPHVEKAAVPVSESLAEKKLRLAETLAAVRNHETYFGMLGRSPEDQRGPGGKLQAFLCRDFGSVDNYKADLYASALAASSGWAWTVLDHVSGKLFNFMSVSESGPILWHVTPIVALDMNPHARGEIFSDPQEYLDAIWEIIDWEQVERRLPRGA